MTAARVVQAVSAAPRRRPGPSASLVLLAGLCGLGGCAAPPAAPTAGPAGLAGTTWQLVALQSMDDAQGTQRPAEPARYTVHFGPDGQAHWRLDCNRGHSGWQQQAASDGHSGQLSFGALASTRAMCAPDSLAPQLARQLPHVRGYLLKDGQLHLSLLADGGILSWAPLPP